MPARCCEHPRLEQFEAVEVEVVGGLVEQVHVEAAQLQRGERSTCRLAARQRRRRLPEQPIGQTERVPDLPILRVEVGGSDRQPAFERDRVPVARHPARKRRGRASRRRVVPARPVTPARRRNISCTVSSLAALGLLHQTADVRRRWSGDHRAGVGRDLTGEHAEQRRLADTVRSDETGAATGDDRHIDPVEDDAGASHDGDATGEQGCGHAELQAIRDGRGPSSTHACHGHDPTVPDTCSTPSTARLRPSARFAPPGPPFPYRPSG